MRRPARDGARDSVLALMAACLAVMVAAVALVLAHDLVPDASLAMTKVAGAGLVAAGLLDALRL